MKDADVARRREPEFLTRDEVAALARVTIDTVEAWDKRRLLPRVRPPGTRRVLYPRTEVLAWLRDRCDGGDRE